VGDGLELEESSGGKDEDKVQRELDELKEGEGDEGYNGG
jgi:hypothetical protein